MKCLHAQRCLRFGCPRCDRERAKQEERKGPIARSREAGIARVQRPRTKPVTRSWWFPAGGGVWDAYAPPEPPPDDDPRLN